MMLEAGVLKKLILAGLAKLRFGLASAGYSGLGVHERPMYTAGYLPADSTQHDEIPGVGLLAYLKRNLPTHQIY